MIFKVKKLNSTNAVILNNIKQNEIIATIAPYKIEGLPILEVPIINPLCCIAKDGGVTKMNKGCAERNRCIELPNQEEDIEKLALKTYPVAEVERNITFDDGVIERREIEDVNEDSRDGFIAGYKAAQKQNSEDDVRNAFKAGRKKQSTNPSGEYEFDTVDDYLQSLQRKQFPIAVELTEDLKVIKWIYK